MHQGNWTCSNCGGEIKELPFEPRRTDGLKCRDCHFKAKDGGAAKAAPQGDRQMHSGDWHCSSCGEAINELPFEPRNTDNLKCKNCFRKTRA